MAFKPLQYDSGLMKELLVKTGETISKFDALEFEAGEVKRHSGGDTPPMRFVALEGVTTASAGAKILALDVRGVEFEADCENETAQNQVGIANALEDHAKVANDNTESTDENQFVITQIVGPASAKKARGYFLDRINA